MVERACAKIVWKNSRENKTDSEKLKEVLRTIASESPDNAPNDCGPLPDIQCHGFHSLGQRAGAVSLQTHAWLKTPHGRRRFTRRFVVGLYRLEVYSFASEPRP